MQTAEKLKRLTEGAKYDGSCSSSGSSRAAAYGKIGLTSASGICHSFTPDGRCVALLKVLMSNMCIYNCKYCVNRSDADVARATMSPQELCTVVMGFYKRNYIEGLFISSAVVKSPDYTMELMIKAVSMLREECGFNGYIHFKGIPGCSPELIDQAAALADRLSFNIELPSRSGLKMLAPQKTCESITESMRRIEGICRRQPQEKKRTRKILPAGQTTQMIIGATADDDARILTLSERMYLGLGMKRVYYSAYIPAVTDSALPDSPPNLIRENRLYQADWLLRFYGFTAAELTRSGHNLDLDTDPKSAWALRNLDKFPVEINTADYSTLLRVPGIGVKGANKITAARRYHSLDFDDLKRMRIALSRAKHFILCRGKYFGAGMDNERIKREITAPQFARTNPDQLTLTEPNPENDPAKLDAYISNIVTPANTLMTSVLTGEL